MMVQLLRAEQGYASRACYQWLHSESGISLFRASMRLHKPACAAVQQGHGICTPHVCCASHTYVYMHLTHMCIRCDVMFEPTILAT